MKHGTDIFDLSPSDQMRLMVRRLVRMGTDVRLLTPQVTPAEAEKLAQAKLALERAERLISELIEKR